MTFIPSVISKIDTNNSYDGTGTFLGTWTSTNGYNSIQVSISSIENSIPCGLTINFSPNQSGTPTSLFYTDTYLTSNTTSQSNGFVKTYNIQDKYYSVSYIPSGSSTYSIKTRLLTTSQTFQNDSISSFNNQNEYKVDAFGKLRVSEPLTLLELKFPYLPSDVSGNTNYLTNNLMVYQTTSGTGSSVIPTTNSNCILALNNSSSNSYVISQSRNYTNYQSGKSLLFKASGIMDYGMVQAGSNNSIGVKSRIGYFDSNNGIYFEYIADGNGTGQMHICMLSSGIITTNISQSNWNIDPLDGTGTSGTKLDFTKTQLYIIDIEWLGVGRVRFGFYLYGKIYYCHEIPNINVLNFPFISSPNLPIRYQIINSGISSSSGYLMQICSTVISEGGYNPVGKPFSIALTTGVQLNNSTAETPILMIKGANTSTNGYNYYHQPIIPTSINVLDNTSNNILLFRIRIYKDGNTPYPTITWLNVDALNSIVQYSTSFSGGFSTTGSVIAYNGLFSGRGNIVLANLTDIFDSKVLTLSSNALNQSDILVLTVQALSGTNSTIWGDINWNEYW